MSNVKLNFFPKNTAGNNPGDYEMFIDFDSSAAPSTMVLEAPAGWVTVSIKLYQATVNPVGKIIPDPQKNSDKGSLSSGNTANYDAVFTGAALPAGFFFDPGTSTLLSTGQVDGLFDFLVWIQDGSGDNDYLDPGIKNHG
jgi:hypothetical protein